MDWSWFPPELPNISIRRFAAPRLVRLGGADAFPDLNSPRRTLRRHPVFSVTGA